MLRNTNKRRSAGRTIGRVLSIVALQLICLSLSAVVLIYHGPFTKLRDSIVVQAMNTNEQKYWATWFLSPKEIDSIMARANPRLLDASQNINAIRVQAPFASGAASTTATSGAPPGDLPQASGSSAHAADLQGVTVTEVSGRGYRGKLMVISDPARVTVGLSSNLGKSGSRLSQIVSGDGALGGVNAGGFLDDNFIQNGALPSGIVIIDGAIKWQQKGLSHFDVIGFNKNNVLVISNSASLSQIRNDDLRCAVSFGPALVINGRSLVASGGTSLQPRTAIGQRRDGTVLLLVIDGRQSSSSGVTDATLANILLRNGAYNAANLDGGSSTTMFWDGKVINSPCDILGERSIPTAFIVTPQGKN